ncbi:MAG: hypothetical protein HKN72_06895 [Gemmatimonadetes bacterium]|nr:hypothetical protein [Gemmatimonadota bacterium]NNF12929.1 hypothetical protein [Gemmatimonadota bacterium]
MTSINGLGGALHGLGHTGLERRAPPDEAQQRAPATDAGASQAKAATAVAESPAAGVDPELWAMLSSDERVFYLRNAMTGPLTYGPGVASDASTSPGSRLGGRIDVRG